MVNHCLLQIPHLYQTKFPYKGATFPPKHCSSRSQRMAGRPKGFWLCQAPSLVNSRPLTVGSCCLMPRPSAPTKLLSRRFSPRQNWNCQGQNFVQGEMTVLFCENTFKMTFLSWIWVFKICKFILNDFFSKKWAFLPGTKFMPLTILILSWRKWPAQKFCLGRGTRHKKLFYEFGSSYTPDQF